ncbi:MAG: deoxyribodipyrimidine photo-lyase [Alphaproteobacteria bacterium]|nr:deoxyribodipyrimidine photo-lyase [Alphaproteobacteria bacterium]
MSKPRAASPDQSPAIVWFRQDLRLADNPALDAAQRSRRPLVFLYILDDETPREWRWGGASRWWLHHSLQALSESLAARGARLILRNGEAQAALQQLIKDTGAGALFWNRLYEPFSVARDAKIKAWAQKQGVAAESSNGALLFEPWEIRTQADEPFKVFSPFWRACLAKGVARAALPAPKALKAWEGATASDRLEDWALTPSKPDWAGGMREAWPPGEAGARKRLTRFLDAALAGYADQRNTPGAPGTSRLSPHLHWGEISPLQVWSAVHAAMDAAKGQKAGDKFLAEIGWREFAYHLLFHWPDLPAKNWKAQFDAFPWAHDGKLYSAWTKGLTGYPIVDAGMRELWTTGWMHNRVRMIAASFLIKDLLVDWRRGEAWFWDTLVDADLAVNAASWQWVAGSGADAAPYFRVFNPVSQGEKFDPDGAYVRRWVPELARLPDALIHKPFAATPLELSEAGVRLGRDYPAPIVDHAKARQRALDAYQHIKSAA